MSESYPSVTDILVQILSDIEDVLTVSEEIEDAGVRRDVIAAVEEAEFYLQGAKNLLT